MTERLRSTARQTPGLVRVFGIAIMVVAGLAILRAAMGWNSDLLRLGEEGNVPTWLASAQLLVIAGVFALLALRDYRANRWVVALPSFFLLLSLDETASIHERIGAWLLAESGLGAGTKSGPWMVLFVPIVAVVAVVAAVQLRPYLIGRQRVARLIAGGVIVLGTAAVGFELAANLVATDSIPHRGLAFAEEVGEMSGALCVLWGAILLLAEEGIGIELDVNEAR